MKKAFQTINSWIEFVEDAVSVVSLAIIVIFVTAQVFARYVLRSSILWSEELVTIMMVVMAMFGSARAIRVKMHTDLQGFVDSLPKIPRIAVRIFVSLVTLGFLVMFFTSSLRYSLDAGELKTILMKIPIKICYGSMPIGAALMIYEFARLLRQRIFNEPGKYGTYDETVN